MIQEQNQELIKPTWLYIKQHTVTGLKYFGKTTRNPEKYNGSGKRWVNHLAVHGSTVKTIWSQLFTSKTELVEFALNFSKEHNIVESSEWANLMPENGLDGGSPKGTNKGRPCSETARRNLDNGRKNRIYTPMSIKSKEKLRNSKLGKKVTLKTKEKLKIARAKYIEQNQRLYNLISPNGTVFVLYSIPMKQFCLDNGLNYSSMVQAARRNIFHKGWKSKLISK